MVEKYCPKCGELLEVKYKCPRCKFWGPALTGKNNKALKEIEKMEKEESHQQRLVVAEEELRIAEKVIMDLEPLKGEYSGEIEFTRKMVRDCLSKLHKIKGIADKIEELKVGVPADLWDDIMSESFPSSEQVILEYTRKGWEHRILGYIAGEK